MMRWMATGYKWAAILKFMYIIPLAFIIYVERRLSRGDLDHEIASNRLDPTSSKAPSRREVLIAIGGGVVVVLLFLVVDLSPSLDDASLRPSPAKPQKLSARRQSNQQLVAGAEEDNPEKDYALELDGQDSYVSIPRLKYDGSYAVTIEAWVTLADLSGHHKVICDIQNAGISIGFHGGTCTFHVHDGKDYRKAVAGHRPNLGKPLHIAGVFDGLTLKVFQNGELQDETQVEGSHRPSGLPMTIGANPEPNKPPIHVFCGVVDEVRISSVARYDSDFTPQLRFTPDENTVALYHFDSGTGNVAKDSSGNGFDGEIVGAKWVDMGERNHVESERRGNTDLPAE
ncbi:MAG: LamG domain-containing protein [Planctomycetes bacterium]|nr:LamG domain-containing protein [Planctomycetota bacterium]